MSLPESIIDSHVHLWDTERLSYPWLAEIPLLNRPHLLSDFDAERGDHPVDTIVFVECTGAMTDEASQLEVEWVRSIATVDARVQGIVAHASLEKGDMVADHLDWLASRPLVRGVRRLMQGEPDPEFCLASGFIEGVRLLAERRLTFDACIFHYQMPALIRLVRLCPDVQFVLDHLAKPAIRDGLMDPWRSHIRELSDMPNVVCKISGAVTEADHDEWTPAQVIPYLEFAIEQFGSDRIMFGGDWPVVRMAGSYSGWIDMALQAAAGMSADGQEKFFRTNAERVYRLGA